jgi:aspartate kinase
MKNIKIFKIGGSVLKTPEDFLKIARKIADNKNLRVCIVTSAIKGKTSELIDVFCRAVPEPKFLDLEKFVGLGEIQAAILFESSFRFLGIKSKAVLPWMKEWPLHISIKNQNLLSKDRINEKRDFAVLKKSKDKTRRYLLPLFRKNQVVIVPGFVARDGKGRMVTLGRGGSDISALLISELIGVQELILIKEVEGVLDLDPSLHKRAKRISFLNWEEIGIITSSGAQVLNPISLKYQKNVKRIKVISKESDIYKKGGTEISFAKDITVHFSDKVFSVLTFVGRRIPETPGILYRISEILAKNRISIHSITVSSNLIAIYVDRKRDRSAYRLLSPLLRKISNLKVLNLKRDVSKIVVRSLKFINEPGIIKKIVTPISRQGINIWEVLTVHTDVMIFVENKNLKRTFKIITQLFKKRVQKS